MQKNVYKSRIPTDIFHSRYILPLRYHKETSSSQKVGGHQSLEGRMNDWERMGYLIECRL